MEHKDRSHYRVRKFKLGDPEQEYEPALADLTPSERIALVFQISELAWSIHPNRPPKLPRSQWSVEKFKC